MAKWVTVWGNATSVAEHRPETYARDITLRYPVKCAFGGNTVRLHFSNFCGTEPTDVNPFRPMSDLPTVEQLEEGIEYYISVAKKYGLKVFLGTLLRPFTAGALTRPSARK